MPRKGRRGGELLQHPSAVASTDLALQILSSYSFERPELGLSELAELLGAYRSRIHRAVTTMVHRGFLVRNAATEKYRLGLKLFELGSIVASQIDLRRDAAEPLERLSRATNATTWLVQRDQDEVVDLLKFEPAVPLLVRRHVGTRTPLTFGVVGQVYLAHCPAAEVERLLAAFPTVGESGRCEVDSTEYARQLENVRRHGFALSVDGVYPGITGAAAAIYDSTGAIAASVALSVPTAQLEPDSLPDLCRRLVETAEVISSQLGYRHPVLRSPHVSQGI